MALMALLSLQGCGKEKTRKVIPEFRGVRGESCQTANDCSGDLVCISQTCLSEDVPFKNTGKVCIHAECVEAKDCCQPLNRYQEYVCTKAKAACASGSKSDCEFVDDQCGACPFTCEANQCKHTPKPGKACTKAADCSEPELCDNGRCVECGKDVDCPKGLICEENSCIPACVRNEDCGAMADCKAGRCERRDCKSDRECAALIELPDAVCRNGKCTMPCTVDGQCWTQSQSGLSYCSGGFCKFSGCEENSDCAALFEAGPHDSLALCVEK